MNNQDNCQNRREEIAALVLGELELKAAEELQRHIESCQTCRLLFQALSDEEETIRSAFKTIADKGETVKSSLIEQLDKKSQVTSQAETSPAKTIRINWGKIIKSPIAKIAAAAVIIIAAILMLRNGSVDITTPAFGVQDVLDAIKKTEWMHIKYEITELHSETAAPEDIIRPPETWISVNPHRMIQIFGNGNMAFSEDELGKETRYAPESNKITITYKSRASDVKPSSIENLLFNQISDVEKRGGKVTYTDDVFQGNPVTVINIDTSHLSESGFGLKLSMFVDPQTRLPKKITLEKVDGQSMIASGIIDYPEKGPVDIYELGAPQDAEVVVIDKRDQPELIEALKPYNKARDNLVSDYILITTYQYGSWVQFIEVIYNHGKTQRSEYHPVWGSVITEDEKIAYSKALGDSFETLLKWSQDYENSIGKNLSISIYDGQYLYKAAKNPSDEWTIYEKQHYPDSNPISLIDLSEKAWPYIPPKNVVKQIENSYSRENNLLAFQVTTESNVRNGKIFLTAQKTINYLDPIHDYICVRKERFHHLLSGSLGETKLEDVRFDPNEIPEEISSYQLVSEFGQTEDGHWYPKEIESYSKNLNINKNEQPLSLSLIMTLYVKTNPDFPAGIFDPNNLPKQGN